MSLSYLNGPGCQQNNSFDQVSNENQVTSEPDSQLGSVLSDILAAGLECGAIMNKVIVLMLDSYNTLY